MKLILVAGVALLAQLPCHGMALPDRFARGTIEHSAGAIRLCNADEPRWCMVVDMPREAGRVQRVIHGDFLHESAAALSWIAFTSGHASMCFVPRSAPVLVCTPVGTFPQDLTIYGPSYGTANADLYFVHKEKGKMMTMEQFRTAESFAQRAYAAAQALGDFAVRLATRDAARSKEGPPLAFSLLAAGNRGQDENQLWWDEHDGKADDALRPSADDGFDYPGWVEPPLLERAKD